MSEESLDVAWWPVDGLPHASRDEIGPLARGGAAAARLTRSAAGGQSLGPKSSAAWPSSLDSVSPSDRSSPAVAATPSR